MRPGQGHGPVSPSDRRRFCRPGRNDNESTYVLRSDRVLRWDVAELALTPTEPWEVVQAGNCGSPMETADGWLVLMHGVGPMRRYVLSAVLLDLDEPTKVIGRLASLAGTGGVGTGWLCPQRGVLLRRLDSPRHAGCPLWDIGHSYLGGHGPCIRRAGGDGLTHH